MNKFKILFSKILKNHFNVFLIICLLHIFAFYISFAHYFLSDDFNVLYNVKTTGYLQLVLSFGEKLYRLVPLMIHKTNFLIFGLNPANFSMTSIFFKIMTALALFKLLKTIGLKDSVVWLSTIIFSFHFAQTEAVVSYASLGELTMTLSLLLAMIFHLKENKVLSGLFFLIALLSKESGAVLILLIPVYDLFNKKFRFKKYLHLALILFLYLCLRVRGLLLPANEIYQLKIGFNIVKNFTYLLNGLLFPLDYNSILVDMRAHGVLKFLLANPFLSILIALGYLIFGFVFIKIKNLRVYIALTLVSFLPVITMFSSGQRFLFLPLVFFSVAASIVIIQLPKKLMIVRFLYPLFLFFFLVKSQFPWIEASDYTKRLSGEVLEIYSLKPEIKIIYILDIKDNIGGAYALRNGSDVLGYLLTDERVKTIGVEHESEISDIFLVDTVAVIK